MRLPPRLKRLWATFVAYVRSRRFPAVVVAALRSAVRKVPATEVPASSVPALPVSALPVPASPVPALQVSALSVPASPVPALSVPASPVSALPAPASPAPASPVRAPPAFAEARPVARPVAKPVSDANRRRAVAPPPDLFETSVRKFFGRLRVRGEQPPFDFARLGTASVENFYLALTARALRPPGPSADRDAAHNLHEAFADFQWD